MTGLQVRRTATTLSDGRDLFYFDAGPAPVRDARDERGLTAVAAGSELRYDPVADEWVIVAAHRQQRIYQPALANCPLCPSGDGRHTEIPAAEYQVAVFENRFAALGAGSSVAPIEGLLTTEPGVGRCEVVCFTCDHNASFVDLSREQVATVMAAWVDRTAELSARPEVEQVFCFENRGKDVGVTLEHPHGQIYAYPFVTPRTTRAIASASAYLRRTRRNLFEDLLAAEIADGSRVVARNDCWTAFVPHAARWPYEVHLYPNRRVPDLAALTEPERADFAGIYLDLLRRFDGLFETPAPYISAWHQAPVRYGREHLALHLELFTMRRSSTKLKFLAGSESGMGVFANDISPEQAAEQLRSV